MGDINAQAGWGPGGVCVSDLESFQVMAHLAVDLAASGDLVEERASYKLAHNTYI
jgi:hypothetical protein